MTTIRIMRDAAFGTGLTCIRGKFSSRQPGSRLQGVGQKEEYSL
jgi:hypothetical protein